MNQPNLKTRTEIESVQTALQRLLAELLQSNSFYRARLTRAGITHARISIDEFIAKVPFTTKAELQTDQAEHPPYGSNLTYPIESYVRLHQTSSTTGSPLRQLDTAENWSAMVDDWVTVLKASGVMPRDRLFAAFSFGPFIGFWLGYEAAARMGCLTIPGGALNSVTRLRAIMANHVTVLCCTPTYAIRLGETARDESIDLSASHVRTIVVGGEPGGSIPGVRARIESLWPGAKVFDHHGMTEIGPASYQCPAQVGTLHLIESSLLCEFVNPDTGEPHDESSDNLAELVVTTLLRTGNPVLRYRTGDLVRPKPIGVCECGRSERALIGGVISRADDLVFVRGVNLYPSVVDNIIRAHDGIVEYRVEVRERRGMSEIEVVIEPDPQCTDSSRLEQEIAAAFHAAVSLRIPVRCVPPGTLERFEFKARRWMSAEPGVTA